MICTMGRDLFRPVVGVRPLRLAALEPGGADSSSLTQATLEIYTAFDVRLSEWHLVVGELCSAKSVLAAGRCRVLRHLHLFDIFSLTDKEDCANLSHLFTAC
jgi:hypothetical protein